MSDGIEPDWAEDGDWLFWIQRGKRRPLNRFAKRSNKFSARLLSPSCCMATTSGERNEKYSDYNLMVVCFGFAMRPLTEYSSRRSYLLGLTQEIFRRLPNRTA